MGYAAVLKSAIEIYLENSSVWRGAASQPIGDKSPRHNQNTET